MALKGGVKTKSAEERVQGLGLKGLGLGVEGSPPGQEETGLGFRV